ncbi:hypothetical protein LTS10_005215 [Elasticomyces elasticus]|nr:hypothetical protein LTS10_005215 [Elasticomyces elasticus]
MDCVGKDLDSFDGPGVLRSVLAAGFHEDLDLSMWFVSLPMKMFSDTTFENICRASDLFANLESLRLMLDGPDEEEDGDKLPGVEHHITSYSAGLIAFICQARNLTDLGLYRGQPRHRPEGWTPNIRTANKLLRAENLPKLETLNLCGWAVDPGERLDLAGLSAFLLRSVATIRDVWITYARKDKAHNEEDSTAMKVYLEGPNSGHQLEHFEMLGRPLVNRTASLEMVSDAKCDPNSLSRCQV